MADTTKVHIGENSAEHIAYRLLEAIALKSQPHPTDAEEYKKWLLDTYAECIEAVTGKRYIIK